MVGSEWAINWDAAVAPPLLMIPDQNVFSPRAQEETASATEDDNPGFVLPWADAVLQALAKIEEERGSAFQRDSLHVQSL